MTGKLRYGISPKGRGQGPCSVPILSILEGSSRYSFFHGVRFLSSAAKLGNICISRTYNRQDTDFSCRSVNGTEAQRHTGSLAYKVRSTVPAPDQWVSGPRNGGRLAEPSRAKIRKSIHAARTVWRWRRTLSENSVRWSNIPTGVPTQNGRTEIRAVTGFGGPYKKYGILPAKSNFVGGVAISVRIVPLISEALCQAFRSGPCRFHRFVLSHFGRSSNYIALT